MKLKVSAIVPAFNEEKNIAANLNTLINSKYIDEVICVNDASTDNTLKILKRIKGIILLNNKKNRGKAYSVSKGIKRASGDIVVLIDADLIGLKEESIKNLVNALQNKRYNVAVGYPYYYNMDKICKPLAGERAYFKKDLLPYLKIISKKGYALELYLNYLYENKKIKLFPLKGTKHPYKQEKQQSASVVAKLTIMEFLDIWGEIIKQDNPFSFIFSAYLKHYYFRAGKNSK